MTYFPRRHSIVLKILSAEMHSLFTDLAKMATKINNIVMDLTHLEHRNKDAVYCVTLIPENITCQCW